MGGLCAGRIVIITGAGRGLGRSYALAFAREGAKVVVNDLGATLAGIGRDAATAQAVVDEIRAAGGEAVANGDDVSDWDSAGRIVATAIEHFGGLDVVVNNAGVVRDRMFVSATVEEWDATMKVHLRGHFCVARHAVDYWRACAKQGKPVDARIINTTSGAGLNGSVAQSAYSAAKGGIASLTLVQAAELGRYGITANALAPAARTRMTEQAFAERMKKPGGRLRRAGSGQYRAGRGVARQRRVARGHRVRLRARGRQDHDRPRLERRTGHRQARPLGAGRGRCRGAEALERAPHAQESIRHMSTQPTCPPILRRATCCAGAPCW